MRNLIENLRLKRRAFLFVRRMFEDGFPHPVQRYRITPAREPFLMTDRKPQNPHFFLIFYKGV